MPKSEVVMFRDLRNLDSKLAIFASLIAKLEYSIVRKFFVGIHLLNSIDMIYIFRA